MRSWQVADVLGELAGVLSSLRDLGLECVEVDAGGWTLMDDDGDCYGHALGSDLVTAASDLLWQYRVIESLSLAGYEVGIVMDDGKPQAPDLCELSVTDRVVASVEGVDSVRAALEALLAWAADRAALEWPDLVDPAEEC